ncbi:MAG TPA: cytochrome c oxidase subunit I [Actinomycetota bacterium]|jgi:cytochrome c oxidase subunit 1|nr:cytochrome c oxidase subunit I [Actinomycetota bacterium]
MAVSEALPQVSDAPGPFRRPSSTKGILGWLTTVDHKRIGILYGVTAFIFFLIGGSEALLLRLQLARPDGTVLDAETYNRMFTMHGITMIFFVVMPLGAAFFNYLIPLMIGARDVAFPRLNAFSYWVFLFGGIFVYSSFFLGGAPDCGWFCYANLSTQGLPSTTGVTFFALGLQITGVASLVASVNFVTTIINLRAPGMSFFKMPMFIWMTLVVNFLLLFAMPVIAVALFQLMFDTMFGTNFFNPAAGGDPVLWQHMFWLFGHPEVYILILPAMGIVSEVLPTFARKPLFGYAFVAFSGIAIGFMGWGVWAHHMFAAGLGPVANSAFAVSTMFIAVPTGVKIFNWLGTVWGGKIRLTTPMLFSIGFVTLFIIGGLSGVTHAIVPADYQQTDTYYIVAHFHYVLFTGAVFGLFSGIYYWWPKITGKLLSERIGKVHFWLMFIGGNLTFGPMHVLGLQGMSRRYYTYPKGQGFDFWNAIATLGAFTIALSIVVFIGNVLYTRKRGRDAGNDPWDARTLEWSIPSPPPHYNFAEIPTVTERDDWWHHKYTEDEAGKPVPVVAGGQNGDAPDEGDGEHDEHEPHMPKPSYWPLVASASLPLVAYGLMFQWVLIPVGVITLLVGVYGWGLEPVE